MADLASYLLRSAAFLAVFYALYWLTLRRETFFALNRAFLLAGASLSLVLPLLRVPSPFFKTIVYAAASQAGPVELAGPTSASPTPGAPDLLAAVYLAGTALFLLLFVARLGRLALLARRCGCVRQRGLRIVLCGHPGESFSFFHFVFLNRSKVPAEDIDRVLAHELAHVRQLHSLDILFTELLTVIQWFNPFVWPYKRSLRETHEYLADRAVIAQGCGLARYQLLIVEQHVGGRLLELASSFRTSQIKRRIVMLSKQQTKGLARWKPLLILPLAVVLVLAFAESRTIVKPDPAAPSVQEQKGGGKPTLTEEEMAKALQEKMLQLDQMKQKNTEIIAKLEQKLAETSDAAEKEKIKLVLQDQTIEALDISVQRNSLLIKKIEFILEKETDPAKRADLEKKLEDVKADSERARQKAEDIRKAMAGPGRKLKTRVEK
jgi:hypothetical protein